MPPSVIGAGGKNVSGSIGLGLGLGLGLGGLVLVGFVGFNPVPPLGRNPLPPTKLTGSPLLFSIVMSEERTLLTNLD
jgi:hypothetical protein